jgi:hypothetical protein
MRILFMPPNRIVYYSFHSVLLSVWSVEVTVIFSARSKIQIE